jgi:hypothetical protein
MRVAVDIVDVEGELERLTLARINIEEQISRVRALRYR